jgi:MscS family membrane protein
MSQDMSNLLTEIIYSVGIIAVFVAAGKGSIWVLERVVKKLTEKTATKLDDMILAALEKPIFYLISLWGVFMAVHRLREQIGDEILAVADDALFVLVTIFVVKLSYDVINAIIDWYGMISEERGRGEIAQSIVPLVKKLVKLFVMASGLIVVLDHFDYNISSLVAALGVSSLAIGLAAKDTLSHMIAGFVIMADRPFRVGDRIELEGNLGEIVEIGLRSTKLLTVENNIVVIPNSKLVDNIVLNYAYPANMLTNYYKIGVEYGSDIDKVRALLLDIAKEIPEILDDPAPNVFFVEHADSSLDFKLVYRIQDYRDKWTVLDKVNTVVNKRFAKEGIGIAFPTRTLHVINEK